MQASRGINHAVVLAGGATRGAYQIGVWRALRELEVDPSIVSGVSIGSLNAALIAMKDWDTAERLWLNLDEMGILSVKQENIRSISDKASRIVAGMQGLGVAGAVLPIMEFINELKQNGLLDPEPLRRMIQENVRPAVIKKWNTNCYICYRSNNKLRYYNLLGSGDNEYVDILFASCMIDYLFPLIQKDEGVLGHAPFGKLPVEPIRKHSPDIVWIVHSSQKQRPVMDIGRSFTFNLIPSCAFEQDITGGFLVFDPAVISKWMNTGYLDTIALVREIQNRSKLMLMSDWILRENQQRISDIYQHLTQNKFDKLEKAREEALSCIKDL